MILKIHPLTKIKKHRRPVPLQTRRRPAWRWTCGISP